MHPRRPDPRILSAGRAHVSRSRIYVSGRRHTGQGICRNERPAGSVQLRFSKSVHIARFCRWLAPETTVHVFTIWAPLEVVLQREATRAQREPLGQRVIETYATLQESLSQLGWLIENLRTPDEAADEIERILGAHPGRKAGHLTSAELE
jgi:hypothetical protein